MPQNLTKEQAKRVVEILNNDPEATLLLNAPEPKPEPTEAGVMLGGGYELAGVPLLPPCAGHMALLSLANNQILIDAGEAELMEMWRALYIIQHGISCVQPLMGLSQRRMALERYADRCTGNPEMYAALLAKADQIESDVWTAFDQAVCEWAKQFDGASITEVSAVLVRMLIDAQAGTQQCVVEKKTTLAKVKHTIASIWRLWLRFGRRD